MAAAPEQQDETALIRDALKEEYELEKELGRGGMAVVYKGRDKQLEREVAIKVLPFSLSFDAEFVERFQREARTAAKLEHPNIIPIYRVGKSGRVIYFVMKFIRGKSLSAVIENGGAMPLAASRRMLIEAASALGYAHKHGIVHRDIKPDNIMFDEQGQAIVADFGIAKAQSGAKLTGTGMSIGTPHYMSPEQARAQNLDGRSDIYSLGVVAYQALTGHVPFDGEDSFSIGYKHIMEELPTPPLETAEQREMFAIIQKTMAKKPEDRFQTAEEMIAALEALGTGGGASAGMQDMSTMPTRAIEPMKAPAKPAAGATAPLPRASASMGKPKEAAPVAAAAPAPKKPAPRPAPKKSKAPVLVAAVIAVILAGLAGGYFGYLKPQQDLARLVADSTHRADSLRTDSLRADSIATASAATAAADSGETGRATVERPTPATSRTPTVVTPPVRGADGTLVLEGVPSNATATFDGRPIRITGGKVPSGRRQRLEIRAPGMQNYAANIDVQAATTQRHRVTMVATRTDPTPVATDITPPAAVDCSAYQISTRNPGRACWDSRPRARSQAIATLPDGCTGTVRSANILVRVTASGEVSGTPQVYQRSGCPAFDQVAQAAAAGFSFTPATKGGAAVEAWVIVPVQARRP